MYAQLERLTRLVKSALANYHSRFGQVSIECRVLKFFTKDKPVIIDHVVMKCVKSDFLHFIALCEPNKASSLSCFARSLVLEVDVVPISIEFISVFYILDEAGVCFAFFNGVGCEVVEASSNPHC